MVLRGKICESSSRILSGRLTGTRGGAKDQESGVALCDNYIFDFGRTEGVGSIFANTISNITITIFNLVDFMPRI